MKTTVIAALLLALAANATVSAQTTWIVGTGGSFYSIQHAIDSSLVLPGDTLQLVPGPLPHEGFNLHKPLTIRGPATITGDPLFAGSFWTVLEPVGGRAFLIDLDFVPATAPLPTPLVEVRNGKVTCQNCRFHSGVDISYLGDLTLDHCDLQSTYQALRVGSGSFCTAVKTDFTTTQWGVTNWGHFQGQAITIQSTSFSQPVRNWGSSWIADSVITGNSSPSTTRPTTFFARTSSNVQLVNANMNAPLVGCWFQQPTPQIGQPFDLEVRGEPNQPVLIELTLGLDVTTNGGFAEPRWTAGQATFPFVVLTTDASSAASLPLTIPNFAALRGLGIWAHPSAIYNGIAHTGPPAGGLIR